MTDREPIEFYFDIISPYGYLASKQIELLAARNGRDVDWRPVLLGITVMKIMGMKPLREIPLKGDYLYHDAARTAAMLGIPFRHHGLKGINSIAAMRAFLWIKSFAPLTAVVFAKKMYERLWVRGEDITDPVASAEEAEKLGIEAAALLTAINSAAAKQALHDTVDAAVSKGVFGVPFFIADGESFWGGDRLPMLQHWLTYHSWSSE